MKIVAFTGHRPQKLGGFNENNPIASHVRENLRKTIKYLIRNGCETFISGMAIGVDTWVAELVLDLKEKHPHIALVCAVPFKGQESRWYAESVRKYNNILSLADKVHIVSKGSYSPYKMQVRNEWMVDNADILVAVWDGTSGGTGNCVKYARDNTDLPMIRVNPNIESINPVRWLRK